MGRRYRASSAVSVGRRVVFGTVRAAGRRGNAAVENWFEVFSYGTGEVGAAVLRLSVRAGAEGTYGRVLATGFHKAEPPRVITVFGGGRVVGSLDNIVATNDRHSVKVGQGLPVLDRDLYHDRKGFLTLGTGNAVWVEESGLGDEDRLGIENRGLEEGTQSRVDSGLSLDGEAVNGEL